MTPPPTLTVEELLEHSAWVRALARRLVADAATADDMVQEAWLAALASPPRRGTSPRAWLAQVVRNAARMAGRGGARRDERERASAREEALAGAHAAVERAELQTQIATALLALPEPYRTTLILRYFESLPPRAIAARLGVGVETVHTRLQRGLERLRKELGDRRGGGPSAWLGACLPLARAQDGWTTGALGWITMKLKLSLAAVALVLFGALAWIQLAPDRAGEPADGVRAAAGASSAPEPRAPETMPAVAAAEPAIEPATEPATEPDRAPAELAPEAARPAPAAAEPLRGKVIDDLGRGLADVALVLQAHGGGELARTRSGAGGAFVLEGEPRAGIVVDAEEGLATVLRGVARASKSPGSGAREGAPVVVVARRLALAGRTVDELGVPLAGVTVEAPLPEGFRTRFTEVLDASEEIRLKTVSDAQGAFRLDDVPALEGARLLARLDQFDPSDELLPAASDANLVVTLRRTVAREGSVQGRVVDAQGAPAAGARVSLGVQAQSADSEGRFVFALEDPKSMNARFGIAPRTLTAAKPGFLPATFEAPLSGGKAQWPASVVLRLGEEALQIHGRVVGSSGDPIAGVRVFVSDATMLGGDEHGPVVLENLLAGDEGGHPWRFTETDEEGFFDIDGLLPREYVVRAMDMDTLLIAESKPVLPGPEGIEIELDTAKLFPRVAGRITGGDGKPVARASVFPMCDAFRVRHLGQTVSTSHGGLDGTTTDAEGRFELRNVPTSLVYLRIEGADIVPLEYGRWIEGDPRFVDAVKELPKDRIEDLEIRVGRRCHFQVELADPTFADEVAVLDGKGDTVEISVFAGNGRREGRRQPIVDGRSDVIACPDTGAMVIVRKGGAEVSRRKLELVAGEVTLVRF